MKNSRMICETYGTQLVSEKKNDKDSKSIAAKEGLFRE